MLFWLLTHVTAPGQGINRPKWCPFENVTAYLTPGKSTGEVRLSGQSAISVPAGVHQVVKKHNNRLCPYYVTVKDCVISSKVKPTYVCKQDELTVYWPTDTFLFEDTKEIPGEMEARITDRLKHCDIAHLLEVVILYHDPLYVPDLHLHNNTS
ncbi:hypothetical protein EB796_008121 [Bugula neritina]|uniref:Uncharacterized protein n=1 Tax=Bugula neritina TaxID=10212 RepID=A0A7J7K5T7_BUGNE|nr:hypothetical protein EB796_008121 [Bugula neritina]